MFTGVIRNREKILSSVLRGQSRHVRIGRPKAWKLALGESIAVNGICTTVRAFATKHFDVEYMPATRAVTTADEFSEGRMVHLEKPLRMADALDGHFVQGHIDAVGTVARVDTDGGSHRITVRVPAKARRLIAPWGSITLDGVSLTVQDLGRDSFTVALVSHTLRETMLGDLRKGDRVNIETDMFARYVAQLIKK